jgi:hypothetical protein
MKQVKIDNFDFINPLLSFDSEEDFYYLQIIKRRKDNPELPRSEKTVKSYFLYEGELMKFKGSIADLCRVNNARAYLRLNRRNIKDIAFKMNKKLADYLMDREYKACESLFESACGNGHSEHDKKWLIDFDTKDYSIIGQYIVILANTYGIDNLEFSTEKIYHIPTINGYHIICRPFNTDLFAKLCLQERLAIPSIHKDNPTLLYFDGETNDTEPEEIQGV